MERIIDRLRNLRHRDSTRRSYYGIWKNFNRFCLKLDRKPKSWENRLLLYVAYLINENKQSTTIKSYISAIKAVLKDNNIVLNEDEFLLSSLMRACKICNDRVTTKLPIYKELLAIILAEVHKKSQKKNQPYLGLLYQTLFSTAYFGLFRTSELTATPSKHAVKATDVQVGQNKKKFMLILRSSKTHCEGMPPQIIKISSTKKENTDLSHEEEQNSKLHLPCPYNLLWRYSVTKPPWKSKSENFFVFRDNSPVKASDMRACLQKTLKSAGFNHTYYGLHSLRSGRTGDMVKLGLSVDKVQRIGRWKSNAVFKYLKYA